MMQSLFLICPLYFGRTLPITYNPFIICIDRYKAKVQMQYSDQRKTAQHSYSCTNFRALRKQRTSK